MEDHIFLYLMNTAALFLSTRKNISIKSKEAKSIYTESYNHNLTLRFWFQNTDIPLRHEIKDVYGVVPNWALMSITGIN